MQILENVLGYIFPPRCPVCDGISKKGICINCRESLYPIEEPYCLLCGKPLDDENSEFCHDCKRTRHLFFQNRAVFSYKGQVRNSLYRMKYYNRREYAAVFAGEIADKLGGWIRLQGITMIVPVPLHSRKYAQRGYNQAGLLAIELGRILDIEVNEGLLFREKNTRPQKIIDKYGRKYNMIGAFAAINIDLSDQKILLVDDIYTTGNTIDSAAMALQMRGARKVCSCVVAIGG